MLRFEIALTPEAADRFDAVFRMFVQGLGPDAQSDIHQVAFQVMGGERRIVMFETDAQRRLFTAGWEAVAPAKTSAAGDSKSAATPRRVSSPARPEATRPESFAAA
jgi:hypothetical protein